jgi:hypothetical protein
MRKVAAWLVLASTCAAQLACSFAANLAAPRITVENIVALPPSAGQQRFRVGLLIDNPNTEPMPITDFEFTLRLANQGLLDGRLPQVTVPALDRYTANIEVGSELIASLSQLRLYMGPNNTLPYELVGRLSLGANMGRVPFTDRGEVPLATEGGR